MSDRYHELHRRKVALVAEGETILAQTGPNGDLGDDQTQRFDAIQNELETVNAAIGREEAQREMERKAALEKQPDPAAEMDRLLSRSQPKAASPPAA